MANRRLLILLLPAFGLALNMAAQPGSLDASFNTTNGPFRWIGAPVESAVWSVLPLRNGQVLVGGPFEQVEGLDWAHLARLNADGSLDRTFTARPNRPIRAMIEQPDGRILIAGEFNGVNNQFRDRVARLEPDGSLDTNFVVRLGLNGIMHALALQPDGKAIVGGAFHVARDEAPWIHNIIRLETNGLIDFTFDPGTNLFSANIAMNFVRTVVVLPDGKIMAGGTFNRAARSGRDYLARLLPNGVLDPAFGVEPFSGPSGPVYSMALQAGRLLVIGGSFTNVHGVARTNLARMLPDGAVDETFFPHSILNGGLINSLAVDAGGRVLAIISGSDNNGHFSLSRVFRFDAAGRIDSNQMSAFVYRGGGIAGIATLALHHDGGTFIGGTFDIIDGVTCRRVALLLGDPPEPPVFFAQPTSQNGDAGLDVVLNASVSVSSPTTLQWFKDGEALPGSTNVPLLLTFGMPTNSGKHWLVASNTHGVATSAVANVVVNDPLRPGAVDLSFAPRLGANSNVWELASGPEGGIYVGGEFTRYDTNPVGRLIRIDEAGVLDRRFLPTIGSGNLSRRTIGALRVRADGSLLVAGYFDRANGQPANHVLALTPEGAIDPSFNFQGYATFNQGFFALEVDESDRVLAGGWFTALTSGADPRRYNSVIRLFRDGTIDTTFRILPVSGNVVIYAIRFDDQGQILVAGNSFAEDDYGPAWDLMRLNTSAGVDLEFRFNGFGRGSDGSRGDGGVLNTVFSLPDGSIVAGGLFAGGTLRGPDCPNGCTHTISNLVRFSGDGRVDPVFTTNSAPNGPINAAAIQLDGKLIIAGAFTSAGGGVRNGIARLNRDGTCDVSWHPGTGPGGPIEAVLIRNDGQILVGGRFTKFNGHMRGSVALLNGGPVEAPHLIDAPTNICIVAGTPLKLSHFVGGYPPPAIQWLLDGIPLPGENRAALRHDYSRAGQSGIYSLVLSNASGVTTAAVASVSIKPPSLQAGAIDPNFVSGVGADGEVMTMVVQPDGRIILGGAFRHVQGMPRAGIARLHQNGALDSNYDPGVDLARAVTGVVSIAHLVLQPDGKTLLSGAFTRANGYSHQVVARVNANGSMDAGFATLLRVGIAYPIAIQMDGKIILTGGILSMSGVMRTNLARLHADGSIDVSFLAPDNQGGPATALAIQPDGRILWALNTVHRLLPDGSRDPSFSSISLQRPNFDPCIPSGDGGITPPWIYALNVQQDGGIIVGGAFFLPNSPGRDRRANLLRLLPSGAVDEQFNASSNHYSFVGPNYAVRAIATEPNGKILIGGCFTAIMNTNSSQIDLNPRRSHIARLNADGSLETTFDPGAAYSFAGDGYVRAIALQPDGHVLIGGQFDTVDGVRRNNFARLTGEVVLFETASDGAFFSTRVATTEGRTYWLETRESAEEGGWTVVSSAAGDGTDQVLRDSASNVGRRFYRVRVE